MQFTPKPRMCNNRIIGRSRVESFAAARERQTLGTLRGLKTGQRQRTVNDYDDAESVAAAPKAPIAPSYISIVHNRHDNNDDSRDCHQAKCGNGDDDDDD